MLPPTSIQTPIVQDLPFLCDTANIPGVSFITDEVRHKGYGLIERRPVQTNFEEFDVIIIGDGQGAVIDFIQRWLLLVNNFTGERETSAQGVGSETFNYPEEYWGTLELHLYNIANQNYQTFTMHKAFPLAIGAVQVGWEQVDSLMRIPVSFAYRSYTSSTTESLTSQASPINTQTSGNNRNIAQLEKLLTNPDLQEYQQRFLTV